MQIINEAQNNVESYIKNNENHDLESFRGEINEKLETKTAFKYFNWVNEILNDKESAEKLKEEIGEIYKDYIAKDLS